MKNKFTTDSDASWYKKPLHTIQLASLGLFLMVSLILLALWEYYDNSAHIIAHYRLEASADAEYVRNAILKLILSSEEGGGAIDPFLSALNIKDKNQVRMIHSQSINAQYAIEREEFPINVEEEKSLIDGKTRSWENDDVFVTVLALTALKECQRCHHMPGKPEEQIPVGYVIGLVEVSHPKTSFNISQSRLRSRTIQIIGIMVLIVIIFTYSIHHFTSILKGSEQKLKAIMSMVGEVIIVVYKGSRILFLNN